ncbi:MAG: hypothetical protein ABEJ68_00795 [Halobacteriaceae archaeon]
MSDHGTRVEDGTLYVDDGEGGWLEVGTFDDIYDVLDGETIEVEYEAKAAAFGSAWLDVDDDDVLTIDVRETVTDMTYPPAFVAKLAERSVEGRGIPERTTFFAESMERVWRSRGSLPDDENPFLA